jgi:GGDEF domain-containing protein
MDEIAKLRAEISKLNERLREETLRRLEVERRASLLEKLAYRDPSTGLRTESYLHARVREEIDRAIRFPSATSLVTLCAPKEVADSVHNLGLRLTDELRATDQVFQLSDHGLAILLVETGDDGARQVLDRLSSELEQLVKGYGYTVTSFPMEANLADDFMNLALEKHQQMGQRFHPDYYSASENGAVH